MAEHPDGSLAYLGDKTAPRDDVRMDHLPIGLLVLHDRLQESIKVFVYFVVMLSEGVKPVGEIRTRLRLA